MGCELEVGARCLVVLKNPKRFFLLVEIDIEAPRFEKEPVIALRLKEKQAKSLSKDCKIKFCKVEKKAPKEAKFLCVFISGKTAFNIFEVEKGEQEKFILVPISLKQAISELRKGARKCTIIK